MTSPADIIWALVPALASVAALALIGLVAARRRREETARWAMTDPHPEEIRRSEVTVAVLVEDHPDPAGEVKLWPLAEVDETEQVDGW